ncbi:MAG: hypothetical protein JXQ65_03545 [Candidatus Marinimicrobia bacterium]|nr:hypothetical protein [Candidatus Neomarinimicrobiota bacterium]
MNKPRYFQLLMVLLFILQNLFPCTTGLVDRKYATGKRAILWKNRDSSHEKNEFFLFKRGDFKFFGIINNNDTTQVWSGVNNFGFAIMNAESRDLITIGDTTFYDDEGYLMKEALTKCKSIEDFEKLLSLSNISGRKVTSNFGVIDASGRGAYFETGNCSYIRYDADQEFLIRANFSLAGRGHEKYGLYRYQRAKEWFEKLKRERALTPAGIINHVIADPYLVPSVTKENFHEYEKVLLYDSICRYSTVAVSIVEGIKKNEHPEMTTFWLNLGHSAASVSIPLWLYSDSVPNGFEGIEESELNALYRKLRAYIFEGDPKKVSPEKYLEIRQKLDKIQMEINHRTAEKLDFWRKHMPTRQEVAEFQNDLTQGVLSNIKKIVDSLPL